MKSIAASISLSLFCLSAAIAQPLVPQGTPIDEAYRAEFARCDQSDHFNAVTFPIKNKKGKTIWYGCHSDPSRFSKFESVQGQNGVKATIIVTKLGRDDDGSPKACSGKKGPTDQCPTSLMLPATQAHPCIVGTSGHCVPVDADTVPYVVIPGSAPSGIDAGAFAAKSGRAVGDYGVVIANGRIVSVVIADQGPAYKIGEGSAALLKQLSSDDKPHTRSAGVTFIGFPNTHVAASTLSPDTFRAEVLAKGCAEYRKLVNDQNVQCR